ncbi:ABC transporter ATP-binding protein [Halococcoides cellulosivorans]|uniref:ABC transporter ATP-binding protein n=1 Tax=Halococcoides cellulosivorans TaxID=1679096 RepID=A0A2R4WZS3_9EURY|nr:ABC transporter ATP-binding protein [Halococcoides cellulosivorans]AWB27034.1 ABC transporter ATP-binding protein [Halococcoides cellulosivorans]
MAVIDIDGLSKEYGSVTALNGIDLTVESGEVFGFLGPNGAGKSTTINILLDFVRPTAGSAQVFGMDAQRESQQIRRRTGVLPEGYQVYERLTGREHVEFVADSKDVSADPATVLGRVGLDDAIDRQAGGYSKGMRQRMALGMALVGDPDLLILDEPSAGLDPTGVKEIRDVVNEEAASGTTVFFSSHILSQVEAVCDRVAILNEGTIAATDTIDGLRETSGKQGQMTVTGRGLDDAAVAAVEAVDGVTDVVLDDALECTVEPTAKIDVLEALTANGVEVDDIETGESSLEDLFMHYTEATHGN